MAYFHPYSLYFHLELIHPGYLLVIKRGLLENLHLIWGCYNLRWTIQRISCLYYSFFNVFFVHSHVTLPYVDHPPGLWRSTPSWTFHDLRKVREDLDPNWARKRLCLVYIWYISGIYLVYIWYISGILSTLQIVSEVIGISNVHWSIWWNYHNSLEK